MCCFIHYGVIRDTWLVCSVLKELNFLTANIIGDFVIVQIIHQAENVKFNPLSCGACQVVNNRNISFKGRLS